MFSTFSTEHGTLIIRTEDLRRIEDVVRHNYDDHSETIHTIVEWAPAGLDRGDTRKVQGTAAENYARLQAEELRLIEAAAERQRRYDGGLPLMPIPRGRAGR